MKNLHNKSKLLLTLIIIITFANYTYSQTFVPFKQRLTNGGINLKGDITLIANNIVSKDQSGTVPNDDYHGSEGNNKLSSGYIDIDNDPNTFSSSKSALNLPSCSRIVYAGLYWAAVYPKKYWNSSEPRSEDFNEIKFKLPGGNYQDIIGDIIFDGQTQANDAGKVVYTCYKDVTSMVGSLSSPNGDYYAADIKATVRGTSNTGSSGGWIMVVIYENENEPSRRISIFDGFSSIKSGQTADIAYSGFNTIPNGPVKAKMLLSALEGDKNLKGDKFQFRDVNGTYQSLSTPNTNPATNFLNGTITINDAFLAGRKPSSQNTLGFDADLFNINNVNNKLIANNQTSAEVKFTSSGDGYWVFLNALSVDIIEPDIELVKTIDDGNGNDIGGGDVDLGDILWYNINFKNKGNDDAINTELLDRLPKNVDLIESELIVPNGVTYTYEPPTISNFFRGELKFNIPDNLVQKGDPSYNIRIKVKVVENCNELRDVCSNRVENQAFITYTGKTSGVVNSDNPSFYGVNACNIGLDGPSNFLVNVDGCQYERDEILCALTIDLTAGNGFLSYEWKNDKNEVIGTTQTITVSQTGRYTVTKIAPVGCISTQEIINVVSFNTQENPLLAFADEVKTCPNDGTKLSEIYLCGDGSTKEIKTNIFNSNTILWQKLDEASCGAVSDESCANTDNACTWNTVKTGNDFIADTPGQYRLEIRSQGGCFKRYYFNVFKATLNPQVESKDIICGTPGSITINNIPNDYEFSLNATNSFQDSNTFNITAAGRYDLYIRKKGASATTCVYTLPAIDIVENNIEVELITQPIACSDSNGEIRVQVNNVPGEYTYKLIKGGMLLATSGAKSDNDHSFEVTEEGTYTVEVTAPNSCSFTGEVTFIKPEPLNLTAINTKDISCTDGLIELNTIGGTPIYNYALWSYNGVDLYASVNDIPLSFFSTTNTINIPSGQEGTFEYIVIDSNNCWAISNPVTINLEPKITFKETINDVVCNGETNASFEISVDGSSLGYQLEYSIDDGATYQTSGVFNNLPAGTQTIKIKATKGSDVCLYEKTISISEPASIVGSASITQEYTCTTPGEITFDTPTGGSAPYQFSVDGANYTTSKTFTNLNEGTYQPFIKDANNCILTLPTLTINPLPIAPNFTPVVTYNCDGTGNIEVTPTDLAYTFRIDGGTFSTTAIFNNVSEGSHTIDINYGKNCIETIVVDVEPNKAFTGAISNVTNVVCNGSDNGAISISAENFGNSFEYSLNGASWVTVSGATVTLNNLPTGSYGVRIKSDSCIIDLGTQIITEPTEVNVTASITQQISCTNTGATITPQATGGTAPYQFSIDNGVNWVSQFTNVAAGTYTITARDANNCLAITDAIIQVDAPQELKYTATSTQCFTGSNGQIDVLVTEGNGNYVFSINNGPWQTPKAATPNNFTFTNLIPDTYIIKVKDALGCESVVSNHTIYPELNAIVETTDINCTDGKITVNATGGDGNYVYAFVGAGALVSNSDFGNSNTTNISSVGNYDVYVRDHSGNINFCETVKTVSITNTPELVVNTTPTHPTCFGETGALKVELAGGAIPFTIVVSGPSGYSNTTTDFYGSAKEFFNLEAGNYTITVTGEDTCSKIISETIVAAKELTATTNPIIPSCGITDLSLFGFEFVVTENYAPYILEYSADNGTTWSTNPTFMGIASGTKVNPVIRLLETDGTTIRCLKVLDPLTIPFHVSNLVVSTQAGGSCTDGFEVKVSAKDGIAPYQFAINSTSTWINPTPANSSEHIFKNLTPGLNYTFYVKDSNGCIKQNNVDIYDSFTPDVLITGSVNNNACATADNGEITFSIDDSNNPLVGSIDWKLFNKQTSTLVQNGSQANTNNIVVSNLPAGDYYLTITNGVSCSWGSEDVTITKGTPISGLAVTAKDITCNQSGIIEIKNVLGGFGNYQFTLTSTNFITPIVSSMYAIEVPLGNLIDPTISSTVSVKVNDQSTCDVNLADVVINVSETPEIKAIIANSCDTNKTITITAEKGLAPYYYSIDNGVTYKTSSLFENLTAGDYNVKIRDSNGCISDPQTVTLVPTLVFETLITKNLDCSLTPNAEVQISVTSGSGNYDFEVRDSANNIVYPKSTLTPNPINVSFNNSDTYSITVYDNEASLSICSKTVQIEIPKTVLPEFTYTTENSTCEGSNSGVISLTEINPTLTYSYSISPSSGTFDTATNSFINVAPGNYQITATGSNGCIVTKTDIVVTEFNPIVVPTPTINEFGCTVGNTLNNASISVDFSSITGGSGVYTMIEFVDNKGTATTTDDILVQKGTNSTYTTNDKSGGNYTINVYDNKSCVGSTTAIINPFEELISTSIAIDKAIDCATGENISVSYTSSIPIANVVYSISGQKGFTQSNSSGIFTNLSEDTYTISVKNTNTGCELQTTHQVVDLEPYKLVVDKQSDITCFGSSTGAINLGFSSDTPYTDSYNYVVYNNITGVPTQISGTATSKVAIGGLPKGEYYARVTMPNTPFCTVKSEVFTIDNPVSALDFELTTTPVNCSDAKSGKLSILANGGWGNYQYQIETTTGVLVQPFGSNSYIENLEANTYVVTVKDKNGCELSKNVTLENPQPINAVVVETTPIICEGDLGASIAINTITGGQGNPPTYSYQLQKNGQTISAKQASNIFNGLAAGDYTVIVSDEYLCDISLPITINEPVKVQAFANIISSVSCLNNNANVEVSASGGTGNYTYSSDGVNFASNNVFNVLSGKHLFYAKDSNGCISEASAIITIDDVAPLTAALNITASLISCSSDSSAVITGVASGGFGDYRYELLDAANVIIKPTQSSAVFENLGAGTYRVRVTSKDCVVTTEPYTITEPEALVLDAPISVTEISCFGAANGSITINASGGTGNLVYSINGLKFVTTNTFENLSAGNYNVIIQDERGCFIRETVTITEPVELQAAAINISEEICFGDNNASFELEITGGTAPYKTKLNGGDFIQNQVTFTNLEGGKTHVVFIEDSKGCETQVVIPLKKAVELDFNSSSAVNCTTYLSTITATVAASFADEVVYSINGGTAQKSGIFEGLADGNYTVKVSHINGCEITNEIVITNPEPLTFNAPAEVTNVLCYGANDGTITINATGGTGDLLSSIDGVNYKKQREFTNLAPGTYEVSVKDELNCIPITETVTIEEPTELLVTPINIKQVTCIGSFNASFELQINGDQGPYQTRLEGQKYVEGQFEFNNLEGGKTYKVYVRGNTGCEKIIDVPLEPAVNLELSLSTTRNCSNSSIITANINQAYKDDVMYSINDSGLQKEAVFNNFPPGDYTVTAIHKNGCSASKQVTIDFIEPLSMLVNTDTTNKLIVSADGGVGPYTYSVNDGDFSSNNEFIISETKSYKITTRDALGCEVIEQVAGEFITIFIPNFFTPNGNGENDYWYPEKVQEYHNIRVQIYDRYSRLLKTFKGIQQGWDGIYNNVPLPSGDYWYVVYYTEILGDERKLMGNFTLYR